MNESKIDPIEIAYERIELFSVRSPGGHFMLTGDGSRFATNNQQLAKLNAEAMSDSTGDCWKAVPVRLQITEIKSGR